MESPIAWARRRTAFSQNNKTANHPNTKPHTPMKRNLLLGLLTLCAGSLLAADASPKDAAKKLADQKNYSWKTTVDAGPDARFRPGPTEGRTEKDGFTTVTTSFGDNTTEAVLKGDKVVISTEDGWQTAAELSEGGGQPGPGRFLARMFQNFKAPAAQAEDIAAKTKDLKEADGAWKGDLTEEGAKQLLSFGGRRGGGAGPEISNAKGWVKFWIKDGVLTKFEHNVQGEMSFNNNDIKIDRTTTTEIKDVGTTKVTVPDGAKKKHS